MKPLILPEAETLLEGSDSYVPSPFRAPVFLLICVLIRSFGVVIAAGWVGTDSWALHHGFISVTPLQASFAEPEEEAMRFGSEAAAAADAGGEEQVEGRVKGQWKM